MDRNADGTRHYVMGSLSCDEDATSLLEESPAQVITKQRVDDEIDHDWFVEDHKRLLKRKLQSQLEAKYQPTEKISRLNNNLKQKSAPTNLKSSVKQKRYVPNNNHHLKHTLANTLYKVGLAPTYVNKIPIYTGETMDELVQQLYEELCKFDQNYYFGLNPSEIQAFYQLRNAGLTQIGTATPTTRTTAATPSTTTTTST